MVPPSADLTPPTTLKRPVGVCDDLAKLVASRPKGFNLRGSRLFAPVNASPEGDGWYAAFQASQSPTDCARARYLMVEDDLDHWRLGDSAAVLSKTLVFATGDHRVLLEQRVNASWQHNVIRVDTHHSEHTAKAGLRPRWCDRPPWTLQCLYRPWSHCVPPAAALAAAVHPSWPNGSTMAMAQAGYERSTAGAQVVMVKASWLARAFQSRTASFRMSPHTWGALGILFRPRQWVARLAGCIMARASLTERSFINVHIREPVAKTREVKQRGIAPMPRLAFYHELAEVLAKRLRRPVIFVQTDSATALQEFSEWARTAGFEVHHTENDRSDRDSWGGWMVGGEMASATVAAVNALIAHRATAIVSPASSAWTTFLHRTLPHSSCADGGGTGDVLTSYSFCCRCRGKSNFRVIAPQKLAIVKGWELSSMTSQSCREGFGGAREQRAAAKSSSLQVEAVKVKHQAAVGVAGVTHPGGVAASSICNPMPEALEGRRLAIHQAWRRTITHMMNAEREHGNTFTDAKWHPDTCEPHAANGRAVQGNRTLWFFGNSVTRIHFFAAHAILSSQGRRTHGLASNVSLIDQILHCGKGGEWHGKRPGQGTSCLGPCSCSLDVPGRSSIRRLQFVWQQKTFDNILAQALVGNYSKLPVRAGDMVVINTGLDGAFEVLKRSFTHKKTWGIGAHGQLCEFKGNYSYFEGRWRRELRVNAQRLAQSMLAAWRVGRRVFWRTSTPACFNSSSRTQFGAKTHLNPMLAENDAAMSATLRSLGAPVLDLRAIDVDINSCKAWRDQSLEAENNCRCQGYLDLTGLHPGPQLAARQIARLLAATDEHCHSPSKASSSR